ncbi:MAG: carotenoid oxygenase family protein [Stenomitos frigidus ULC029]
MVTQSTVHFPKTAMTASRQELTPTPLTVVEGQLPPDWYGHLFLMTPAGTEASGGLPNPEGTHFFNSDGMIYRFDLSPQTVTVTSKLAKTPCYYADVATYGHPRYARYGFQDFGLLRFSTTLGLRDEVDIAFLPFRAQGDTHDRLMVTYDAGRPYEIDTTTLEIKTPIGANDEWQPFLPNSYPFPPVLCTAHPAYDPFTNEVFLVNFGRSLTNLLEGARFFYDLEAVPQEIELVLDAIADLLHTPLLKAMTEFSYQLWQQVIGWLGGTLDAIVPDFTYLVQWDGVGQLRRWKLVLPDGSPVRIEQTMHQLCVTQDYVVLMDTPLKIGPEQILNNPLPNSPEAERLMRRIATRPQLPDTPLYVVRRADLQETDEAEPTVIARPTLMPLETVHFATDYDNPNGQITLHAAHLCATDLAEWVRQYDTSKFNAPEPSPLWLAGMLANGQMDIGRVGRYTLDGESGQIVESKVVYDTRRHWGIGFYTLSDRLPSGAPRRTVDTIYWQSLGFWTELLTEFIYDLYKTYPHRAVALTDLLNFQDDSHDRPSCLFRVDTATMETVDVYEAPVGYCLSSPQFVPRQNGTDDSTDGYLVCTAFGQTTKEIWVLNAADLSQGPLCKLSHPDLNFGFSIHAAWLPAIAPRTATYHIPIQQDYQSRLTQPDIQQLFAESVYPHFV